MPASKAVEFWMQKSGHRPADPPAAYFTEDGRQRRIERARTEPTAEAVAAAKTVDVAEVTRLRGELALSLATALRRAGTFDAVGESHPMLISDNFVPRLPGVGASLLADIFG